MELDEPEEDNPAAAAFRAEAERVGEERAAYRVFGSKPGAYGAGLQALIDESIWRERDELGDAYLEWGGYAYGSGADGSAAREDFSVRLGQVEAVVQNQDNREHDVLDSDDYYQFEGGISAAVEKLRGTRPTAYHNDHSRPERPRVRTLEEEIGRVSVHAPSIPNGSRASCATATRVHSRSRRPLTTCSPSPPPRERRGRITSIWCTVPTLTTNPREVHCREQSAGSPGNRGTPCRGDRTQSMAAPPQFGTRHAPGSDR